MLEQKKKRKRKKKRTGWKALPLELPPLLDAAPGMWKYSGLSTPAKYSFVKLGKTR